MYHLQIVTPDGLFFDGQAKGLLVPASEGQLMVLPGHINFVTTLSAGHTKVMTEQGECHGTCSGGMLVVTDNTVKVVAASFAWESE